jgi:spermidine synthase
MTTVPVLALLLYNVMIFAGAMFRLDKVSRRQNALLAILFFCSGMPALIYQIVWQRALFAIYGANSQSVAAVVSAFMLGLGLGSLAGGWLSARFPKRAIMLFSAAELGTALYGVCSLHIFRWASSHTAGVNLPATVVLSFALLIIPTVLMGATLPLLVEHFVRFSGRVGYSVATLYFVNTFGSAVACYICATFLLRDLGQSGSVLIAACVNTAIGACALLFGRSSASQQSSASAIPSKTVDSKRSFSLAMAMLIAAVCGFVALGFEIIWFRVLALASSDRAQIFALLLSTYLAGIAAGAYIAGKSTEQKSPKYINAAIGTMMIAAGGISVYLPPLVALLKWWGMPFLLSAFVFFLTAALLGSVLPMVCQLSVSAGVQSGRQVSLVYVSNIAGSALGSLLIGFVLMQYFGLRQVSLLLAALVVASGCLVLFFDHRKLVVPSVSQLTVVAGALIALFTASGRYSNIFERLTGYAAANVPFAHVVENRNSVIAVTQEGAVLGGGVYDGVFNVDPLQDVNLIVRAFALSSFHPAPKHMLMIGLSSGSWGQVLVSHPQVESLDIVEINPGYLQLISQYPSVQSLVNNPKAHIYIDDGRRWLLSHPSARYDAIVTNTSFYWRDHISALLSTDFLSIAREHLNPGGVYYYNTTGSDDVVATGLKVFHYGLRVHNFLALSDSPLEINKDRWMSVLRQYKINNRLVFDDRDPASKATLNKYNLLADSINQPHKPDGMENFASLNARLKHNLIITDDNMGWEWRNLE